MLIALEGNIGSGKTTLFNKLKNDCIFDNFYFADEPLADWEKITDSAGKNILEYFYSDSTKYSTIFQLTAYLTRVQNFEQSNKPHVITERSLLTDRDVFSQMLFDDGKINEIEYKIYKQISNRIAPFKKFYPDAIIYMDTDPDECMRRIIRRNRPGEENIPIEYLKSCDHYHQKMVDRFEGKIIRAANLPYEEIKNIISHLLD